MEITVREKIKKITFNHLKKKKKKLNTWSMLVCGWLGWRNNSPINSKGGYYRIKHG